MSATFDFSVVMSSREELKLYTMNYSNACGRTAVLDHSRNNQHTAIYICKERLKNGVPCPFEVVWKMSRRKCKEAVKEWRPIQKLSCLQHPLGICGGTAEISRSQVINDAELCNVVSAHKGCKRQELLKSLPLPLQSSNSLRMASTLVGDIKKRDSTYQYSYSGVNSWISTFLKDNPGSIAACENTNNHEFFRAMLCPKCVIDAVLTINMRVHAMDAGTVVGEDGFKGVVLVLEAMDSNCNIFPLALGLVPSENADNYQWLLRQCKQDERLHAYLNSPNTTVISDRDKGLKASLLLELPYAWHRYCAIHIKKNLCKHIGGSACLGPKNERFWAIQGARTRQQYEDRLNELREIKPKAADYLAKIDPDCWVLYSALERGIALYGRRSSNDAEVEMSRLKTLGLRFSTPIQFLEAASEMWLRLIQKRIEEGCRLLDTKAFATEACHRMYMENERLSRTYQCVHNSCGEVYVYVGGAHNTRYMVTYEEKKCTCGQWQQYNLICSHGIAAATALQKIRRAADYYCDVIGECYRSSTFISAFNDVNCKITLPNFDEITMDDTVRPIGTHRGTGALMKRRMKNAAEPGGVSCRTPKQRQQAAEHVAQLQLDEEGNELPVEKESAVAVRRRVICKRCGEQGHMQKTCKNSDIRMRIDDIDTLVSTGMLSEGAEPVIGAHYASV